MEEPYFRIFGEYRSPGPVFYARAECPWLEDVEHTWRDIRAEVEAHCRRFGDRIGPSYVPDDVEIRGWQAINLVSYRHWYRRNCAALPRTTAVLRAIPHLTTAFVSILGPHASLPPHNGDTNTTYRCHLGLAVPGEMERCGLEVGGHRAGWREGEAFAFNEAHRHFVWNHTDSRRVVLVFDVMKPAYRPRQLRICSQVLGAMTFTMLETNVRLLRRLPPAGKRALHRLLGLGALAVLLVRDRGR